MKKFLILAVITILFITGCGIENNNANNTNTIEKAVGQVTDKQMTLNFAFGSRTGKYTGEIDEQGLPNGKGKFTSQNTDGERWTYEGDFKNGHFDGQGVCIWSSGQKKEGEFKNDLLNGNGKWFENGNLIYGGRFENGDPMLESVEMNTDIYFDGWKYKVTNVETAEVIGNAQASGQFLIVMVDVTNNGNEMRRIGETNMDRGEGNFFVIVDDKGRQFKQNERAMLQMVLQNHGAWQLTEINPGLTVKNIPFIFDVPKDIQGAKLLPIYGNGKVNPVKLQ